NPVRYNDPSGHCILCLVAAVGGGVLLGAAIYNNFIRVPAEPADVNVSNLMDLLLAGYERADHATITGAGLQSLQDDPSFQAAQQRAFDRITNKPEYQVQDYPHEDIFGFFTANGPGRNWYQGARDGNLAFWMVHTGTLSATNIQVSADGTIEITWVVTDQFDYLPDWGNSGRRDGLSYWAYNSYASVIHPLYNGVLGARQVPISASWNETKYPSPQ
ncbi:MAG TPA: hypothetical protein PKD55_25870, partial [Bellilinea sp.]|nr:hypothetical protein [Bellilinea sp.]